MKGDSDNERVVEIRSPDPVLTLPPADVGVIVVSYNSAVHLPRFLDSLDAHSDGLSTRVVVVDNGSSDDSVAVAQAHDVISIPMGRNLGYAAAINVGRPLMNECASILVANPDVEMRSGALRVLQSSVLSTGGACLPNQHDEKGAVQLSIRREPTVLRQLGEALLGDRWPTRPAWTGILQRNADAYAESASIDWGTGAVFMMNAQCDHAVGEWQEDYFLYSEEVDYARRVREAGMCIRFEPSAGVLHYGGGSGRATRLTALELVNRIRYYRRWHLRSGTLIYGAAVLLEATLRTRRPTHRAAIRPLLATLSAVARGRELPTSRWILGTEPSEESPEQWAGSATCYGGAA